MTTDGADRFEPAAERERLARRRGFFFRFMVALSGALVVALVAGFLVFLHDVRNAAAPMNARADGIVVLTGGAFRINDALELLSENRGQRLLISGVNPATTTEELKKKIPDFDRLSACCIDLGREAQNTTGNATETARWAEMHKFRSLIVVTSAWHMPRALNELQNEMPQMTLIPYPVVSLPLRDDYWWVNPQTVRLLVFEYLKYLASLARLQLEQALVTGNNHSVASR
ncbi:MAG: YdcF family protein [Xanthobacteraceae bacterium]|nr:YdcF family protein [Xanthobacteraceae bacterium]QYK44794.1 MAG: YdcF family protein [Xanthobacteraceae bacterium]